MTISPIPSSIVKAICAVQSTLEAVKKSQHNTHGNYKFASTDDIYAAITCKMGEVGLVCLGLEDGEPEIKIIEKEGKISQWLKVSYLFVLATEDATWTDPRGRRTIYVQITGPQTFQAAQSYCEKSYLRSLFKIPTGDMDLDSLPEGFEYNPINLKTKPGKAVIVPPAAPPEDAIPEKFLNGEAQDENSQFLAELDTVLWGVDTDNDLHEVWGEHEERICALPIAERAKADALFERHQARVEAANGA